MRLVLAGLTVAFVIGLEMTAYPAADASIQNAASSTEPVLLPDDDISAQSVALAKGDRLFAIAAPAPEVAVADDEVAIETPRPELSIGEFCEALTQAAADSDLPPAFFARLIWQESKFKHDAMSHVGARGVAQFMPATAAEVGLDDPFDPRQALPASAKFLRRLHNQFGNLGLAAAAYNAGPGRIQNWLSRRGVLPAETRNYVRTITGNPAESWTTERKTVGLQQQLPSKAPCEGIGGLSRNAQTAAIPVALTPIMSEIVRKARIEAARAAAAAKERIRLALKVGKRKTLMLAMAKKSGGKDAKVSVLKTAALGHRATKDARIKVASAAK